MNAVSEFLLGMIGSRPIEMAAVCCGLLNVGLVVRRSLWNYPFGIVMVLLYARIFFDARLYSDALLQVYYLAIQLYGFWYWARHREASGRVVVARSGPRGLAAGLAAGVVGAVALGAAMARFTDAEAPYWDASVAALSVVAQFMLSRRLLENWLLWIAVDLLAIALFWSKGLQPTAALYAVFLVMAVTGLLQWRRAWRAQGEA